MTIAIPDGYTVEQCPIQYINNGDTVVSHSRQGQQYVFVVDSKGFSHKPGEPVMFKLEAARETDAFGNGLTASISAPANTLVERIVRAN